MPHASFRAGATKKAKQMTASDNYWVLGTNWPLLNDINTGNYRHPQTREPLQSRRHRTKRNARAAEIQLTWLKMRESTAAQCVCTQCHPSAVSTFSYKHNGSWVTAGRQAGTPALTEYSRQLVQVACSCLHEVIYLYLPLRKWYVRFSEHSSWRLSYISEPSLNRSLELALLPLHQSACSYSPTLMWPVLAACETSETGQLCRYSCWFLLLSRAELPRVRQSQPSAPTPFVQWGPFCANHGAI